MTNCTFPTCPDPATTLNRAEQGTCGAHQAVVVSGLGSWVGDKHTSSEASDG